MLHGIIGAIKVWVEGVILHLGYPGITVLCTFSTANIPIPSEVIIPSGGLLVAQGKMSLVLVAFSAICGELLGSSINYYLGSKLGAAGLTKYGKYLLIRAKEVEHAAKWFEKYGAGAVLWGRFLPFGRSFISLPAGIYKMNYGKFLAYTAMGSTPWCFGWAYLGMKVGENWSIIEQNWRYVEIFVGLIFLALIFKFLQYRFRKTPESEPI